MYSLVHSVERGVGVLYNNAEEGLGAKISRRRWSGCSTGGRVQLQVISTGGYQVIGHILIFQVSTGGQVSQCPSTVRGRVQVWTQAVDIKPCVPSYLVYQMYTGWWKSYQKNHLSFHLLTLKVLWKNEIFKLCVFFFDIVLLRKWLRPFQMVRPAMGKNSLKNWLVQQEIIIWGNDQICQRRGSG